MCNNQKQSIFLFITKMHIFNHDILHLIVLNVLNAFKYIVVENILYITKHYDKKAMIHLLFEMWKNFWNIA